MSSIFLLFFIYCLRVQESTQGWIPVSRGSFITYDLEAAPLQIRTDSELGSDDEVRVWFYSSEGDDAGGVALRFSSTTVLYYTTWCSYWTDLPTTPPSTRDKVWRISLDRSEGVRLSIHCNDVLVLDVVLSDTVCHNYRRTWSKRWSRDVEQIEFSSSWDTASDYYKPWNTVCDTTSPVRYAVEDNSRLVESCQIGGDQLNCSVQCYLQSLYALTGRGQGSIPQEVEIIPCDCTNNDTKESCLYRKNFTRTCFQNECDTDGTRYYDNNNTLLPLNTTLSSTLNSCYTQYQNSKTCSRAECVDALWTFRVQLASCNCYHTYKMDQHENSIRTKETDECEDRRHFYANLTNNCTQKPMKFGTKHVILVLVVIAVLGLVGYYGVVTCGRNLKLRGKIGGIAPYIDWNNIEALGVAGAATRAQTPDNRFSERLSEKEMILKVPYGVMKGCFGGLPRQHVVLKIFSESRCEQQGVELDILNSIFYQSKARDCNIISFYGPAKDSSNQDLVEFLELLIKNSKGCRNLVSVINTSYLADKDRCRYIMMNYCNGNSLSTYMSSHSGKLPPSTVLDICRDLANALDFLHERNWKGNKQKIIVHCDIKPDNILVKKRWSTNSFVLGDFGLAVVHCPGKMFTVNGWTERFGAPEWYAEIREVGNHSEIQIQNFYNRSRFPRKVDIYQFGLIIWLALHNESKPWVNELREYRRQRNQRIETRAFLQTLFSDPETYATRPSFVSNTSQHFDMLRKLAENCWQVEIQKRPSACKILEILAHHGHTVRHA